MSRTSPIFAALTFLAISIASPHADAARYRAAKAKSAKAVGRFQNQKNTSKFRVLKSATGEQGSTFTRFAQVKPVSSVSIGINKFELLSGGTKMFIRQSTGKAYGSSFHKLHYLSGARSWVGQVVTKVNEKRSERLWSVVSQTTGKPLAPAFRFDKISERGSFLVAKSGRSYTLVSSTTGKPTTEQFDKIRVNARGAEGYLASTGWQAIN